MTEANSAQPLAAHIAETAMLALVAAIPVAGGSLSVILGRTLERSRENIHEIVQEAAASAGATEALVARVEEDERLSYLLLHALEAGERTTMAEKRRVLGQAVGRASRDPSLISDSELQVRALRDLDVPHVAAMAAIVAALESHPGMRPGMVVREALAGYPAPIIAALVRNGLVEPESTWDDMAGIKGLNAFGGRLLSDLKSRADA